MPVKKIDTKKLDELARKYYHKDFKNCCPLQKARIKRILRLIIEK